ncbi:MAG: E3 binding domain-containing protein, partial [Desulfobacterales bacterium]
MVIEIKIPSVGESVTEAVLAQWYKADGERVRKDEPLLVLETDKVTLEVVAEAEGVLKIAVAAGETVAIGAVVGSIDTGSAPVKDIEPAAAKEEELTAPGAEESAKAKAPTPPAELRPPAATPAAKILAPSVRRLIAESNLDISQIPGTGPGGRVTKGDVLLYREQMPPAAPAHAAPAAPLAPAEPPAAETALITRKTMSPIRQRIAAHLLEAKQNTAMLTTFNEIDMTRVM